MRGRPSYFQGDLAEGDEGSLGKSALFRLLALPSPRKKLPSGHWGSCAAQSGRAAAGLPFLSRTRWASCPVHLQALSRPVHGLAQAVCGRALAPGPLFFHYAAMRLTFHGSVLILGGSSELGRALALALRAEGAQVCCVCRDDAGCARCAQDGLPALVLGDPETLPARCETLLGRPVGHLADLLHSRFEQLVAMAAPEAIERWADDDIALRARCLRACWVQSLH